MWKTIAKFIKKPVWRQFKSIRGNYGYYQARLENKDGLFNCSFGKNYLENYSVEKKICLLKCEKGPRGFRCRGIEFLDNNEEITSWIEISAQKKVRTVEKTNDKEQPQEKKSLQALADKTQLEIKSIAAEQKQGFVGDQWYDSKETNFTYNPLTREWQTIYTSNEQPPSKSISQPKNNCESDKIIKKEQPRGENHLNNNQETTIKKQRTRLATISQSLNEEQRKVYHLAVEKKANLFFTGAAGTGKSFLLKKIVSSLEILNGKKSIAITATTGIAAVNIGGITLHSFGGLGHTDELSPEELANKISKQKSKKWANNWRTIKTLIIDEVSMLDGELFDKLEFIARKIRNNSRPFGGIQLILVGDFFQLPPVNSKQLCFESQQWQNVIHHNIQLVKVYRQKDTELVELLNEIRFGRISEKSQTILKKLEREPTYPNDGIQPTQLVATNSEANRINSLALEKINQPAFFYQAVDWEKSKNSNYLPQLIKNCPATARLELKKGAQVMLIKNISEKLVNGCQGVIVGFHRTTKKAVLEEKMLPVVRFTNGMEKVIQEREWTLETSFYRIVQARRTQIPLVLSWAITIHKSQGQTIERLKINLNRVFEKGQAYVALSRASSLNYLQVHGFTKNKLFTNEKVNKFYQDLVKI